MKVYQVLIIFYVSFCTFLVGARRDDQVNQLDNLAKLRTTRNEAVEGCLVDGVSHKPGDGFIVGCQMSCVCQAAGMHTCVSLCPPYVLTHAWNETCQELKEVGKCCTSGMCERMLTDENFVAYQEASTSAQTVPCPWYAEITNADKKPTVATIINSNTLISLKVPDGHTLNIGDFTQGHIDEKVLQAGGAYVKLVWINDDENNDSRGGSLEHNLDRHRINQPFPQFCSKFRDQKDLAYFVSVKDPDTGGRCRNTIAKNAEDQTACGTVDANEICIEIPRSANTQTPSVLSGATVAVQHQSYLYIIGLVADDITAGTTHVKVKNLCHKLSTRELFN